jgi:hypothetical protein
MILGEKGMIEVDFPARFAAVMAGEVTAPVKSLQNVRAYSRWAVTRPPPGHEEWDTSMPPVGDWISDDAPDGGGPEPRQVDLDGCLRAAENPDQRADLPPDGNVTRPGSGAGTGATSTDAPSGMAVVPPQKSVARATAKSRRCVRRAKKLKNRKARARAMRRCKRDRGRGSR